MLEAREVLGYDLEEEARRRALNRSDTLLIFLLKAMRPARFREHYAITPVSPEKQVAVRQTLELIASRPSWDSQELLDRLDGLWK